MLKITCRPYFVVSLLTFCGQVKTIFPIKVNYDLLLNMEYEKGRGTERPLKGERNINTDIMAKGSVLSR